MKYGPLKEIWLASYAPFYAFVVYRNRLDAQVQKNMLIFDPQELRKGKLGTYNKPVNTSNLKIQNMIFFLLFELTRSVFVILLIKYNPAF